jgi:hypothetical protein
LIALAYLKEQHTHKLRTKKSTEAMASTIAWLAKFFAKLTHKFPKVFLNSALMILQSKKESIPFVAELIIAALSVIAVFNLP